MMKINLKSYKTLVNKLQSLSMINKILLKIPDNQVQEKGLNTLGDSLYTNIINSVNLTKNEIKQLITESK